MDFAYTDALYASIHKSWQNFKTIYRKWDPEEQYKPHIKLQNHSSCGGDNTHDTMSLARCKLDVNRATERSQMQMYFTKTINNSDIFGLTRSTWRIITGSSVDILSTCYSNQGPCEMFTSVGQEQLCMASNYTMQSGHSSLVSLLWRDEGMRNQKD